ncbi:Alpha/Beta hydrolase fold protein [Quillaja saponaria]|uniref:Alpha/Beta hydrolase fold protein n=1 Tax=Quillaja saponaria TaxID=32244 RepID=A0AAD7M008_QUISA|nr:Alpha/Beta hydrolase fold protein [Quillaja saponaria]
MSQVTHDFPPFIKVYKDGRVERYMPKLDYVHTGLDSKTGVQTKDVVVSTETGVPGARIFLPKINGPDQKLPLLLHYHGGAFCIGSPFDILTYNLLTSLAIEADVIAISVDYRLAPEHYLPIAYDDSWAALQWIATHSNGEGPEPWINQYADLGRVFLMGESAGATIAHHVTVRAGVNRLDHLKIIGVLMVHPFFGKKDNDKMYKFLCPTSFGYDDDPNLNPEVDPNLPLMSCDRMLVCVAERDELKDRGVRYYEILGKSGWSGNLELVETIRGGSCISCLQPQEVQSQEMLHKDYLFPVLLEKIYEIYTLMPLWGLKSCLTEWIIWIWILC